RSRPAARNGGEARSGDDDHSRGSGHHHRLRRPRRSRLRHRRAADVRPLARFLFRPARRPVLLAAARSLARRRDPGDRVLGDPRSRRRLSAGMAGASNGALCPHSEGRTVTLSAQSLTKRYGGAPGYEAVRGASLELRVGEFVSIVGRSGSGKSTLMAMLGALTRPTQGKLLLDGADIWALSETELATFRSRQVGFVFQFPSLLSNLTVVDNVAVPALLGRTMAYRDAYARAYDLLARVGL